MGIIDERWHWAKPWEPQCILTGANTISYGANKWEMLVCGCGGWSIKP